MEDIDLGDRRGLISLVYGDGSTSTNAGEGDQLNRFNPITPPTTASAMSSVRSSLEMKKKQQKEKAANQNRANMRREKKKSGVGCSMPLCLCLILLAVASIITTALVAHMVAKRINERPTMSNLTHGQKLVALKYNMTFDEPQTDEEMELDAAVEQQAAIEVKDEDRHIKNIQPIWYNLSLTAYVPGFDSSIDKTKLRTYDAVLLVKLRATMETNQIELHSDGLNITDKAESYKLFQGGSNSRPKRAEHMESNETTTTVKPKSKPEASKPKPEVPAMEPSDVSVSAVTVDVPKLKVIFQLSRALKEGEEVILRVPFSGPIRDQLNGLYMTEYKNEKGESRFVAMTHFEPQYARRFVPCLDEPKFKAPWKLEITHPAKSSASSNGVIENETEMNGWRTTSFKETPPMSSYLLAIVISEFRYNEKTSSSGKKVRLWARSEALEQTNVALDAAVKVLDHFENYYGIPFPLEKQDMFAVPLFENGAMENWGLLLFREERVLYDPKLNTLIEKKKVLEAVAHEMSHQWFGDLVTMAWWTDLWLNEGLAVYYTMDGPSIITDGSLQTKDLAAHMNLERAMQYDEKATSHPITYKVEQPREIETLFDAITYYKGAVVARMLHAILGEDNFRKGITNYLKRNMYSTATSKDLFNGLDDIVPEDIKAWDGEKFEVNTFTQNWITQMGFPTVYVDRINDHEVELRQHRFKQSNVTQENPKFRNARYWYKWDIPVWYSVDGEKKEMEWLHEVLRLPLNASQTLLINSEGAGFYRVHYDKDGWKTIIEQLKTDHKKIPEMGRARLISDAFALADASELDYETAFELAEYLDKEEAVIPWRAALIRFRNILRYYRDRPEGSHAREFISARIMKMYNKIDWSKVDSNSNADYGYSELLNTLITVSRAYGIGDVSNRLNKMFNGDFVDKCKDANSGSSKCSSVPPLLRTSVYCEGVTRAHSSTVGKVAELIENEKNRIEKARLVQALGCSRDTAVIKRLLHSTFFNGTSPAVSFLSQLIGQFEDNTVVDYVMQDYLTEGWAGAVRSLGDHQLSLNKVIRGMPVHTAKRLEKLEAFLASKKSTSKFPAFDVVIEQAKTEQDWLKRHSTELDHIFKPKGNMTVKEEM